MEPENEDALVPPPTVADGPVFWKLWRERYPNSPLLEDAPPTAPQPAAKRRRAARKGVTRVELADQPADD